MDKFNLDTHNKINPGFKTPEGYFDTFSEKVMKQLPQEEIKVISIWKLNKTWFYAAASILIISFSMWYFFEEKPSSLETVEIENYITLHTNISDDDIVELLNNEDITNLQIENSLDAKAVEDILSNNKELEQYITNQ